jgi:hypothetical protein
MCSAGVCRREGGEGREGGKGGRERGKRKGNGGANGDWRLVGTYQPMTDEGGGTCCRCTG